MGHLDPIAYTYEADYHCEPCALERFGRDEHGFITGVDSEGNEVGIVAPWDEWISGADGCEILACGDCLEVIDRAHDERLCSAVFGSDECEPLEEDGLEWDTTQRGEHGLSDADVMAAWDLAARKRT